MIPNLNELPPFPEAEHPLKKAVKPVLATLFLLGVAAGFFWLFTSGVKKLADEEVNVLGGLRGVAGDLWNTGAAPEVRLMDPDLITELARLRKQMPVPPSIIVAAAENLPGQPPATHELLYLKGPRTVLTIRVQFNMEDRNLDVLSFQTGPEFRAGSTAP